MTSVHHHTDTERIPALHEMSAWGQTVALAYHEAGIEQGWHLGYAAAEADAAARHRAAYAIAEQAARTPTFADLCERRGEHQRAAHQRQLLIERGIVA